MASIRETLLVFAIYKSYCIKLTCVSKLSERDMNRLTNRRVTIGAVKPGFPNEHKVRMKIPLPSRRSSVGRWKRILDEQDFLDVSCVPDHGLDGSIQSLALDTRVSSIFTTGARV